MRRLRSRTRPARGGRPGRWAAAVVALAAVLGSAACQARVAVDVRAARDGSGVLTVGLGLDDQALRRVGDLDRQVRLGDLAAAGWQVSRAHKENDGLTWLRASKPFASLDQLNATLAEVSGPPGFVRDVRLADEDAGTATVHRLTATVDTAAGLALLADPALTARLGSDPVASRAQAIEQLEGRPLADMVAFDVTGHLGDEAAQTVHPTLRDRGPTPLEVAVREDKPVSSVGGGAPIGAFLAGGALVVLMLVGVRRRFAGGAAPVEATAPGPAPGAAPVEAVVADEEGEPVPATVVGVGATVERPEVAEVAEVAVGGAGEGGSDLPAATSGGAAVSAVVSGDGPDVPGGTADGADLSGDQAVVPAGTPGDGADPAIAGEPAVGAANGDEDRPSASPTAGYPVEEAPDAEGTPDRRGPDDTTVDGTPAGAASP